MQPDEYESAHQLLEPFVVGAIDRMPTDRFSTKRLIAEVQATADGRTAYEAALGIAEGGSPHMARHVIHGQVIPELLRGSGKVRFAGFIHGEPEEDDGYGVPSRWRRV